MGRIELLLTAMGLAMDAFAAAICAGMRSRKQRQIIETALCFGIFQAGMPLVGFLLGKSFAGYIEAFDHWIAFLLLLFLGGNMFWESLRDSQTVTPSTEISPHEQLTLAVATSIDALAVGVAFACLRVKILASIGVIGGVTFGMSLLGGCIGRRFGNRFGRFAGRVGGMVLMGIGVKILVSHLWH